MIEEESEMCGPEPETKVEEETDVEDKALSVDTKPREASNKMRKVEEPPRKRNRAERRALAKARMPRTIEGRKLNDETMRAVRKEYAGRIKAEEEVQDE